MEARRGPPTEEELARLRAEARAAQDLEFQRMTPMERMEAAFRLFTYTVEA